MKKERELRYNVITAIIMSAFSLEAMINELIIDAVDNAKGGAASNLSSEYLSILSKQKKSFTKDPTLLKLNRVLSLLELPCFNFDVKKPPYEPIVDLFNLRNQIKSVMNPQMKL
ncbi:hypothetical protein [Halpernia sp. GG3]